MMKKILLVVLASALIRVASAQELSMGLRAGATKASMVTGFADFSNSNSYTGFTGGLYVKAKFLGFFVMPEAMYNQRGGDVMQLGQVIATNTIHYIDVPVLAGKQFFKIFRLNAGPVMQFAIADNVVSKSSTYTTKSEVNKFVMGLQAGAGIDLFSLSFDVRYDTGIGDMTKFVINTTNATPGVSYSSRSSMWIFTVGYRLFKL